MKYLLRIEWNGREQTSYFSGNEEGARKEAHNLFDRFTGDFEFEYEKYIPVVVMYPYEKCVSVNMDDYYKKAIEENEKESKVWAEHREREEFERLQKKFGKK